MQSLKIGDRAAFKTYENKIIMGKVVAFFNGCYLVIGDNGLCGMYSDGLYRFQERNILRG